jgi:NADPH:quinone reductase-like Zn-dependent oxidoreductase
VRSGAFPLLGEPPFTVGWDIAGTVDELGEGVSGFAVGDRVFGMPRFPGQAAAYAEQVVAPAADLAHIPSRLTDEQAAALPLVGLTAWQALADGAGVGPGTRVLIPAAGGGVGHVAVQIAKALGAQVVATASPRKTAFVRALGADEIVDYTTADLSSVAAVDVAIDPLGGEHTASILAAVRDGGTVALLVGDFDEASRRAADERGIRLVRVSVHPDPAALASLVDLAERGQLTPAVHAVFELEKAGDAHAALAGDVRGKLVLVP